MYRTMPSFGILLVTNHVGLYRQLFRWSAVHGRSLHRHLPRLEGRVPCAKGGELSLQLPPRGMCGAQTYLLNIVLLESTFGSFGSMRVNL